MGYCYDLVEGPPSGVAPSRTRAQIQRSQWLSLNVAESLRIYMETDTEIVDDEPDPTRYAGLGRHILE